jgi:hypothetical protein
MFVTASKCSGFTHAGTKQRWRIWLVMMVIDEPLWLSFHAAATRVCVFRQGRFLSASAHAQPGGIRRRRIPMLDVAVPRIKADMVPLEPTLLVECHFCNGGSLSAAALTQPTRVRRLYGLLFRLHDPVVAPRISSIDELPAAAGTRLFHDPLQVDGGEPPGEAHRLTLRCRQSARGQFSTVGLGVQPILSN